MCDDDKHYMIYYRKEELNRIHSHFYHPLPARIYKIMKSELDPEATSDNLKELEGITYSCDICQRLSKEPGRFRVT